MQLAPGVRCFLVNIPPKFVGAEHVGKIITIVGKAEFDSTGHRAEWEISPAYPVTFAGKPARMKYSLSKYLKPIEPPPQGEEDYFSLEPLQGEKPRKRVDSPCLKG